MAICLMGFVILQRICLSLTVAASFLRQDQPRSSNNSYLQPLQQMRPKKGVTKPPSLYILSEDFENKVEEALRKNNVTTKVTILSRDPLVYEIKDLLTTAECMAYQQYVSDQEDLRPMTLSNPPAVSLKPSRLWPLPFMSLLASVPSYLRLREQSGINVSTEDVVQAITTSTVVTLLGMGTLAWWVVLPLIRQQSKKSSRTSVATALNLDNDIAFVKNLVERVVAATNHPWNCWEAPVVTKYEPGAVFLRHGDASPSKGSEWNETGGQRVVTCICYLNTVNEGGETFFDQLDLAVQPVTGKALVFFPADKQSKSADDRTTHESLPSTSVKWIVQMFGRVQRVPPPIGLPESFT